MLSECHFAFGNISLGTNISGEPLFVFVCLLVLFLCCPNFCRVKLSEVSYSALPLCM